MHVGGKACSLPPRDPDRRTHDEGRPVDVNLMTMSFRRIAVRGAFACGAAWWMMFRLSTGVTLEDALITYRFAQNLAAGNGFAFNAHHPVLGTTTPLLTLYLAVTGIVLGPNAIPLASTITMTCLGMLTGALVYCILAELKYPLITRVLSIPLFFWNNLILVTAVGGMETPLVLFCMTASALAFLRRRPVMCLLISALLVLTRPDGIIWAAVMSLAVCLQSRRFPWKAFLAAACVVLPWLVFAVWYFGSPLPHSIVAKQTIGSSAALPTYLSFAGIKTFARWYIYSTGFDFAGANRGIVFLWLLILALGAMSYLSCGYRRRFGAILLAYLVLYGVFLHAGGAPRVSWYLAPSSLCLVLLLAPGVWKLSCTISRRLQWVNPRWEIGLAIAVAIVAFASFKQNSGTVKHHFEFQENEFHTRRAIGLWLQNNTPPESVVAMEAIGYQAFFSQRAVIDLAGLVSPQVVALRKETSSNAELFFRVISMLKPDYIVLRSFEVEENRYFHGGRLFETEEQREYFWRNYIESRRFTAPYPIWGDNGFLTIYDRNTEDRGVASDKGIDSGQG